MKVKVLIFIAAVALIGTVYAVKPIKVFEHSHTHIEHSGGTDKCGCHHNRKTGEYHCHTRKKRGGDCPD